MSAKCRSCGAALPAPFLALGPSPISNAYIEPDALDRAEPFYPLDVRFCAGCGLVQIDDIAIEGSLFDDNYAYFSSFSPSWLEHCRRYCDMIAERLALTSDSFVVEVASNDGYLLQYLKAKDVPVLGVEPTANTAAAARARGVPTDGAFFGLDYARDLVARRGQADLVIANNVLAHVPRLNDFVAGLAALVKPTGTITIEFPHLLRLVQETQFDTIYHEHYSYFSLAAVQALFARHGLVVYDVDVLGTHGGSLRLYVGWEQLVAPIVAAIVAQEVREGLDLPERYVRFAAEVEQARRALVAFLDEARASGRRVVGYGAPAKGNTLLNYCGVTPEQLAFTVDVSPRKQGRYLPGTRIPILAPEVLFEARPDVVLILPWNLKAEIMAQLAGVRAWGGVFAVPIPRLEVIP